MGSKLGISTGSCAQDSLWLLVKDGTVGVWELLRHYNEKLDGDPPKIPTCNRRISLRVSRSPHSDTSCRFGAFILMLKNESDACLSERQAFSIFAEHEVPNPTP